MQSSRRKRERAENEDKRPSAAPNSRTRSARSSSAQKSNGSPVAASQVVAPVTDTSEKQSERTGNKKGNQMPRRPEEQVSPNNVASADTENENIAQKKKSASSQHAAVSEEIHSNSGKYPRESLSSSLESNDQRSLAGVGKNNHEKQVHALLSHRRILLNRIKQCRVSSETRLLLVKNSKVGGGDGASEVTKSLTKNGSDEQEIAAFQEMSRKAINAAKKQRSETATEGQSQEKRAPISLRRGSSVGKRMSIALSSLAPNAPGAPSSSTRESQSLPLHQQNMAPSSSLISAEAALSASSITHTVGGPSGPQAGTTFSQHSKTVSATNQQHLPSVTGGVTKSGQGSQVSRVGTSSTTGQKTKRSGNQKSARTYGGASSRGSSALSPSELYPSSTQPQHIGASGVSLPHNRLGQPSVICPETMALRERRNSIRSRLASLLYERQKRVEGELLSATSTRHHKRYPPQPYSHHRKDKGSTPLFASFTATQRGPGRPTSLPRRRKTHWDYLLEEMRWLATDFIEERKWKSSCSRTISSAVVSQGRNAISSVKHVSSEGEKLTVGLASQETKPDETMADTASNDRDSTDGAKGESKGHRDYQPLSATDLKASRNAATIMSDMISELWDVSVDVGVMSTSDKTHDASLKRHLKLKHKILNEDSVNGVDDVERGDAVGGDGTGESDNMSVDNRDDSSTRADAAESSHGVAPPDETPYSLITERIDNALAVVKNRMVQEPQEDSEHPLMMSQLQIAARDYVEALWEEDGPGGAILDGSIACGKTVAACSLLWKRRKDGPQLLICQPARVFRWKYELGRFDGLRVRTLGLHCGIASSDLDESDNTEYGARDVVVCEFSSIFVADGFFRAAKGGDLPEVAAFRTVVVDCRYQSESRVQTTSTFKKSNARGSRRRFQDVPEELTSDSWWSLLLGSLSSVSAKRLLIESYELGKSQKDTFFGCAGLEHKQFLECLASKAAFVLGPALFYSDQRSMTKKVLSWTKRCIKRRKETGATVNDRLMQMKAFLFERMRGFCHSLQEPVLPASCESQIKWHVRLCSLPVPQRVEYDRCCADLRGALSFGGFHNEESPRSDRHKTAGSALLRLRQVCIHPQAQDILSSRLWSGAGDAEPSGPCFRHICSVAYNGGGCLNRNESQSSSQPDLELALEILKKSAKLRELVTILRSECGYRFHREEIVGAAVENEQLSRSLKMKRDTKLPRRKKVVVLAALPEALILTSVLLNAIGIAHELLMKAPFTTESCWGSKKSGNADGSFERSAQVNRDPVATLAWSECQLSLSRFNSQRPAQMGDEASSSEGTSATNLSVDLVVASPITIACRSGGIGVASADLIVALDEDWSGRGQLAMRSILSAHRTICGASREACEKARKTHQFMRLVCADTCEDKFLSSDGGVGSQRDKNNMKDFPWPKDRFGYLCLPRDFEPVKSIKSARGDRRAKEIDPMMEGTFLFPGTSVAKCRGADLSSVLCSEQHVPPDFMTGAQTCFLPYLSDSVVTPKIESEYVNSRRHVSSGDASSVDRMDVTLIEALTELEAWSCPLTSDYFPGHKKEHVVGGSASMTTRYLTIAAPSTEHLPPMVATRRDVQSLSSRLYVELFGKCLGTVSPSSAGVRNGQHEASFLLGPSSEDNAELADAWHKSGLSCNPDDFASSLLVYCAPSEEGVVEESGFRGLNDVGSKKISRDSFRLQKGEQSTQHPRDAAPLSSIGRYEAETRLNSYSSSYSTCRNGRNTVVRDGNQGCEPRVYFPPLFPNMILGAELAKADLDNVKSLRERLSFGDQGTKKVAVPDALNAIDGGTKKRKEPMDSVLDAASIGKRPRIHHVPPGSDSVGKALLEPAKPAQPRITAASHTKLDAPRVESRMIPGDDSFNSDAALLLQLNEDYGLIGVGALSRPTDSAVAASLKSVNAVSYSDWKDCYESNTVENDYFFHYLACDIEEASAMATEPPSGNSHLDTMLLFVAKNNIPAQWASGNQFLSASKGGAQGTGVPWASVSQGLSSGSVVTGVGLGNGPVNGSGTGKKKKKGHGQGAVPTGASAFSRLSSVGFPGGGQTVNAFPGSAALQAGRGKDGFRNKLISMIAGRQGRHGSILFDYPSFRLAYMRIRNRVSDRVEQSSLAWSVSTGVGPGVPLILLKRDSPRALQQRLSVSEPPSGGWMSLVSKGANDGIQKLHSLDHQIALRRSVESPCRVDFGPFQAGFLSVVSGITSIAPPSPRVGVSLPMGVKIPHQQREQQPPQWTAVEDERLRTSVLRFGQNFHLIAREMANAENDRISTPSQQVANRSARQCRERWNHLTKIQPSLAAESQRVERCQREKAVFKPNQISQSFHEITRKSGMESTGASLSEGVKPVRIGAEDVLFPSALVFELAVPPSAGQGAKDEEGGDSGMKGSETDVPDLKTPKGGRSFASFRNAASKKQEVPMAIPGCISGDATPSLVASHPSHLQSVQAAAARMGASSGRSDMWPLQILDIADKQRGAGSGRKVSAVAPSAGAGNSQQPGVAVPGILRAPNGASNQARHQQSPAYQQQVQHPQQRNPRHQRIAPAMSSPARSPHRANTMAGGMAPAVNQQFVAPQPPPSGK